MYYFSIEACFFLPFFYVSHLNVMPPFVLYLSVLLL